MIDAGLPAGGGRHARGVHREREGAEVTADDVTALAGLATEERLRAGDLIAELNARTRKIGLNTTDWPGLSMYRFEAPVVPPCSEVHAFKLMVTRTLRFPPSGRPGTAGAAGSTRTGHAPRF